jgi:outer membrane protein, heavy metal efflux system
MRRRFFAIAALLALLYMHGRDARAQAPTIDVGAVPNPGSQINLMGTPPGSGGSSFGVVPGDGSSILGGRPGVSIGRTPGSATMPAATSALGGTGGFRRIRSLPIADIPNYGPLSLPGGDEDEGPPDGKTLDELIDIVIRTNVDLRAKYMEIPQAQADVLTASLRANPVFYADSQLVPYGQFSRVRPGGPLQYDINITFPLDVNNKRAARVAAATRARRVIEAMFQDSVRNQIDNLYTAYVDVLNTRLGVDYATRGLEGLEQTLATTKAKFDTRVITESDYIRVKIQRDLARVALADAEASNRKTLYTLASLLYLPPGEAESLKIQGTVRDRDPQELSTDGLIRMALTTRPDVMAQRLGVTAAQANVHLAYRNRFGDVYLLVQPYTFQNNAPYGTKSAESYAVGLTVPLPIVNRNQGNIARAKHNVVQTRFELLGAERQAVTDVQQAVVEYHVSLKAVQSSITSIREAEDVLATAKFRYEKGEDNVLTYLLARKDYNDQVKTYRDFLVRHRRSMLDLNTAVGQRIMP